MKHLKSIVAILLFVSIYSSSCQKSSDNTTSKSKTELIAQSSWKFDHATAGSYGDVTSLIPACFKDNVIVFVSGGTGSISEGANVCSPSNAGTFNWSFQSNETVLHLSTPLISGGSGDFTLVSLTETNLVVSQVMTISPYPSTTVEMTFKH